ncbi:hypothetical protein [uncultured Pseudodesulfovibrio sp.]|uniref:nucleoside-diphosphate sugar epimerase/dehydratase n=1 Tax=uncultured Pseudodesulfovibrio sp. TaxID=2035858 RepID=UPI0029C8FB4E|nr:hypothetical protein [uncultured Pseudodesulfovibrio sp.]
MSTHTSIYIFGAGGAGEHLLRFLKESVRVLGFLDNASNKWGTEFCGLPVLSPSVLKDGGYDHVVVCSAYHEDIVPQIMSEFNVQEDRITNTHALFHDHYFRSRLEDFSARPNDFRCVVTGISYAMLGVLEGKMAIPTFNFAMNGQDLYFDARIWRHILAEHRVDNLEFALIGLTRYSLHYDLSKRKNDMVTRYSHILGDFHNGEQTRQKVERAFTLIDPDYMESIYVTQKKIYSNYFRNIHRGNFNQLTANATAQAKMELVSQKEHIKFYPKTFAENVLVLDHLIAYLKENSLKPILFTVPGHSFYTAKIPHDIEKEFLTTIDSLKQKHDVPFLDMLRADEFNDGHFYDDSHLNETGAELFTETLNAFIQRHP